LVADWLIANSAGRINEYSGTIAGHMLLAGRRNLALRHYLQAGQAALASYANYEAEGYLHRVLQLSPSDVQKAACLAGLGKALSRQGRRQEAVQVFREGIDLYLELEQGDAAADLYARLSRITWQFDYLEAWEVCQEGLRRLEGEPEGPGMALLLAECGRTAFFQAKPTDEVVSLCQRAIEMAEHHGELEVRAAASNTIALVTDDITESIQLMQEVAAFSEANRLWSQAGRAYNNLGDCLVSNFHSLESAHQHNIRAVDISLQTGDIEALIFVLDTLAENLIKQGYLKTIEYQLTEILRSSTVPQSRVEEFLDEQRSLLYLPRGEWRQALEFHRHILEELRETGSYQVIANRNLDLVDACLELNRFGGMADLSEAEAALRENIQMGWDMIRDRFYMVVIFSRQERFAEAREWLAEVIDDLDQPNSKPNVVFKFDAEAEFARAERRWDEAVSACRAQIDIYQGGGYRWPWARQLIDLGDALIGRDGPSDRERAEGAYRQSLEMFTEMGASGYIQVLEERLGGM
jgi:tetratricopeptide (TPR) repeat protein